MIGWLGRACSFVCSSVKTIVKKGVEVVKEVGKAAWEVAKKGGAIVKTVVEKFTGRDKEREAEALLAAMEEKARSKEKEFHDFIEKIQQRINHSVEQINEVRTDLNDRYFVRFEELAANFSTWEVEKTRFETANKLKAKKLETLKTRSELFKIDFRNAPVSSNLKAIFTLGFWSRKLAKESLLAVKEESHRLDYEIEQLNAEKKRLQLLAESLEEVVTFVSDFRNYYWKVLDELDYSVNLLRNCLYVQTHEEAPAQVDPAMLPERHQLCLECADKATRIMFAIGNFRYVETTEKTLKAITADFKAFRTNRQQLDEMQMAFAA